MHQVHRVVRRAALWLLLVRFGRGLLVAVTGVIAAIVLVRIAQRLVGFDVDWGLTWALALGAAALGAAIWTVATRASAVAVARRVDEGAELREALSTALYVERAEDGWSRAAVAHAERVSDRVVVRQVIPFHVPRWWPAPLVGVALFFAAGLVPEADLFGERSEAIAEAEQEADLIEAKVESEEADEQIDRVNALLEEQGLDAIPNDPEPAEAAAEPRAAEQIRRDSIRKLSEAKQRLDEFAAGERQAEIDAIKSKLARLRVPREAMGELGDLGDMVKALQRGDFRKAQESLASMQNAIDQGELSEAQKKQLEAALRNLQQQLEQLAQQQDAVEQALRDAGIDPDLANDPQALEQAIQNAQNLTPQQKQALQQMAQAAQQACKACQNAAGACQNAANQMAGGQNAQAGGQNGFGQLGAQLNELEMAKLSMQEMQAQAAMIQSKIDQLGGKCNGPPSGFASIFQQGLGSGKRGPGGGAAPKPEMDAYALTQKKAKAENTGGAIIGTQIVEAGQIRGEARATFKQVVADESAAASEAIESMQYPREYHEVIKGYYAELNGAEGGAAPASGQGGQDGSTSGGSATPDAGS